MTAQEDVQETSEKQKTKKKDALSVFLMGLVALLGAMYFIDSQQESTLLEQSQAAKSIDTTKTLGERCVVEAAGLSGQVMLVRCRRLKAEVARDKWVASKAPIPNTFAQVAFRDRQGTWLCSGMPEQWSSTCSHHKALDKKALQEARRRRTKREQ